MKSTQTRVLLVTVFILVVTFAFFVSVVITVDSKPSRKIQIPASEQKQKESTQESISNDKVEYVQGELAPPKNDWKLQRGIGDPVDQGLLYESKLTKLDSDLYVYYIRTGSLVTFTFRGSLDFHNMSTSGDLIRTYTTENEAPTEETVKAMFDSVNENAKFGDHYPIRVNNKTFVARIPNCLPPLWSFDASNMISWQVLLDAIPVVWHRKEWKFSNVACDKETNQCEVDPEQIETTVQPSVVELIILSSGTCVFSIPDDHHRMSKPVRKGYQTLPETPTTLYFHNMVYKHYSLDDMYHPVHVVPKYK